MLPGAAWRMKFSDRIFCLERSYYGELQERSGMVIRVSAPQTTTGEIFNKTITYIDNGGNINYISMADISDHETGHEVFLAEVSEFQAKEFNIYPAGLRLPVIAMYYSSESSRSPELMVLGPDETRIRTHVWPTNRLCCGDEPNNIVLQRAIRLLPGYSSGHCGSDVGKQRGALWRMAGTAVRNLRDGKLKKMDSRLGIV
jgi:hypothetical protein